MIQPVGKFVGKQLGNYTLTKRLGTGGFAEVYLGLHKHLEMQATIKVLQTQLSKADQEGFLAEARIVARLRHPHIVHILEFGSASPAQVFSPTPSPTRTMAHWQLSAASCSFRHSWLLQMYLPN